MKHIEKDMKSPLVREAIIRLAVSEKYDSDPRVREIIRTLYHERNGGTGTCSATIGVG